MSGALTQPSTVSPPPNINPVDGGAIPGDTSVGYGLGPDGKPTPIGNPDLLLSTPVSTSSSTTATPANTPTGTRETAQGSTSKTAAPKDAALEETASSNNNKAKSTAAIAGGVIGAVLGLILVAAVIFIVMRVKKRKKNRAAKELLPYASVSGSPVVDENKYPSVSEAPIKAAAAPIGITTSQNNSRSLDSPLPPPPAEAYPQSINTSSYTNSPTTDQGNGFYNSHVNTAHIGQAITTDSPHLLQQQSPVEQHYQQQYLNTDYANNTLAAATTLQRADTTVSGRTDVSRDLDRSVSQNTAITNPNFGNNDPPSPVLSIAMAGGNEPNHLRLDDNRSPSPVYGDEERQGLFHSRREQEVPRLPIYDRAADRGSAL